MPRDARRARSTWGCFGRAKTAGVPWSPPPEPRRRRNPRHSGACRRRGPTTCIVGAGAMGETSMVTKQCKKKKNGEACALKMKERKKERKNDDSKGPAHRGPFPWKAASCPWALHGPPSPTVARRNRLFRLVLQYRDFKESNTIQACLRLTRLYMSSNSGWLSSSVGCVTFLCFCSPLSSFLSFHRQYLCTDK